MIESLNHLWNMAFPGIPPIGHYLRDKFPDRWVRFHSLPSSKRYAESEEEYRTILARHNDVLTELVNSPKVILITTGFSGEEPSASPPKARRHESEELDLQSSYWRTVAIHELEDDPENPNYWHIYISERDWSPGALDQILRLVADDVLNNVMILSLDGAWLYHPYDGGADVILSSTSERDKLKGNHKQWLSTHPKGL